MSSKNLATIKEKEKLEAEKKRLMKVKNINLKIK
jgi:hypothetical protein